MSVRVSARPQQRLNSPIQMLAANGFKVALVALPGALARHRARLLLPVHDEVVLECHLTEVEEVQEVIERVM